MRAYGDIYGSSSNSVDDKVRNNAAGCFRDDQTKSTTDSKASNKVFRTIKMQPYLRPSPIPIFNFVSTRNASAFS